MVTWAKIAAVVCTLLCALLALAFAAFAIVARNQSGVDDWNCREDSPGAELYHEGIYECRKKRASYYPLFTSALHNCLLLAT
jgi:hypothetical protein